MTKVNEDEARKLWQAFDSASSAVKKGLTSTNGGSKAEANYGATYQALVAAGLAPQIRKSYR